MVPSVGDDFAEKLDSNYDGRKYIHGLRDMYRRLSITIHLTPDTDMPADMMTKALYRIKHAFCRDYVLNR